MKVVKKSRTSTCSITAHSVDHLPRNDGRRIVSYHGNKIAVTVYLNARLINELLTVPFQDGQSSLHTLSVSHLVRTASS